MSRAAKVTLGASILGSALIIWGVHFMQNRERETMFQGVIRDDERRREKMRQREEELQRSMQKRELYERVQSTEPLAIRGNRRVVNLQHEQSSCTTILGGLVLLSIMLLFDENIRPRLLFAKSSRS
ncbi:hypothetical protein C8Q79DRAFT_275334 [Trametes meyenii]|nr:hypothetical protein C8Q79DRAFT_275334 [Trametes meyenii]